MWSEEPPLYLQVIGQIKTNEQICEEFLLYFWGEKSADFTRSTRKCGVLPADAQSASHGQVRNVGHATCQLCGFGSHLGAQDGFQGQREVRFWGDEVRKKKLLNYYLGTALELNCNVGFYFYFIFKTNKTKNAQWRRS